MAEMIADGADAAVQALRDGFVAQTFAHQKLDDLTLGAGENPLDKIFLALPFGAMTKLALLLQGCPRIVVAR